MSDSYISYMHSGTAFDFCNPTPDMIVLDDIARGLVEPRFRNQLDIPWMTHQHSILVGELCADHKSEAYMHDGSEGYTGDLPGPFKKLLGESYKVWERKIEKAIAERFDLVYPWHPDIKECDKLAESIEATLFHPYGAPIVRSGFKLLKKHEKMVERIMSYTYEDFSEIFLDSLKNKPKAEYETVQFAKFG